MKSLVAKWIWIGSFLAGVGGSAAWGEMYEWCNPTTGALRLGDQPPSDGIRFWPEGYRPEPKMRDGKPESLCAPPKPPLESPPTAPTCAPPVPGQLSLAPTPDRASQEIELERQKRNTAIIGELVRQTPQYQEGGLADYGYKKSESAFGPRYESVLVLHRGSRDTPTPNYSSSIPSSSIPYSVPDTYKSVQVRDYYRRDGTHVSGYWRSLPSR